MNASALKTLLLTLLLTLRFALFSTLLIGPAWAQTLPGAAPQGKAASCPEAASIKAPQLYGEWTVQFVKPPRGLPAIALLKLRQHAEFSESLSGTVSRDLRQAPGGKVAGHAESALLAGDVEDSILTLDESSNGTNMTGTWNGELVAASCGLQIKGVWKDTSASAPDDSPEVAFVMNKLIKRSGW